MGTLRTSYTQAGANMTNRKAALIGILLGMAFALVVFVVFAYVALGQLIDGFERP